MFDGLPVDRTEDTSTNNLSRKLEKLKRKQLSHYSAEREKEIKRLETLLNPPKTTNKNKKKKFKMDMDDDEYLEQAFRENKDYWSNIDSNKPDKSTNKQKKISIEKIKYRNEIKSSDIYNSLSEDIKSFINKYPDKDIYKKLSLKYHPDKGGNSEYFKIINNYMN